jgi:FtsP/CotA-like multicopper oxidase with cupredoxin domain
MTSSSVKNRLVMENHSGDQHPVHTHRHTFEVTKIGDKSTSGLMKDTLSMLRGLCGVDYLCVAAVG